MQDKQKAKDFVAQNESAIDALREVALREFGRGADGLQAIVKELTRLQNEAGNVGLTTLLDCLSDISQVLQQWASDPIFCERLRDLADSWADVVYELSNYFVFMTDDDEDDLRQRVNYRLTQLAKASASLQPAPAAAPVDGSWGLFDEDHPQAAIPAPAPADPIAPEAPKAEVVVTALPETDDESLASHYLICLLGAQQYALPIHQVREILEQRAEKALPAQRTGIVGLVTVRGLVCPVLDVSHILPTKDDIRDGIHRKKQCMVVCEVDQRTFCFHVDDVKQVASVDEFQDAIKPLAHDGTRLRAISHVSHFQDKSVLFVKMREVIPA